MSLTEAAPVGVKVCTALRKGCSHHRGKGWTLLWWWKKALPVPVQHWGWPQQSSQLQQSPAHSECSTLCPARPSWGCQCSCQHAKARLWHREAILQRGEQAFPAAAVYSDQLLSFKSLSVFQTLILHQPLLLNFSKGYTQGAICQACGIRDNLLMALFITAALGSLCWMCAVLQIYIHNCVASLNTVSVFPLSSLWGLRFSSHSWKEA